MRRLSHKILMMRQDYQAVFQRINTLGYYQQTTMMKKRPKERKHRYNIERGRKRIVYFILVMSNTGR